LDLDKDKRLSLAEAIGKDGLPGMTVETFNRLDLNRDGYLTKYELEQYLQVGGAFSCLRRMFMKNLVSIVAGDLLMAGLGLALLAAAGTIRRT